MDGETNIPRILAQGYSLLEPFSNLLGVYYRCH
jgi:hypothetical protein